MTRTQRRLAGLACLLTIVLAVLDQNIVTSAAVPLVHDLDPRHGVAALPWLIAAYGLAATAALPLYGKLCDTYGAKWIYLTAIGLFLVGSALCGAAQNDRATDRLPGRAGPGRRRPDGCDDGGHRPTQPA